MIYCFVILSPLYHAFSYPSSILRVIVRPLIVTQDDALSELPETAKTYEDSNF